MSGAPEKLVGGFNQIYVQHCSTILGIKIRVDQYLWDGLNPPERDSAVRGSRGHRTSAASM